MAVELAQTNSCATQGRVLPTGTGNIKVASGGLLGTFVGLSYSSLDTSLAMETKPIHGKTKPEGNNNGQEMTGVMYMHLPLPVASSGPSWGFVAIAMEQRYDAPGT